MASAAEKKLLSACTSGDEKQVDKLLRQTPSINVNCRDEEGNTPIHLASWKDHAEIVRKLLSIKHVDPAIPDNIGMQPIHSAAQFGHIDILALLLSHGIDINAQKPDGTTAILQACFGGQVETIKWLICKGADTKVTRHDGVNMLHQAVLKGHKSVILYLLELGFDVNSQTDYGSTPLYLATSKGQSSVIPTLLQAGADPNLSKNSGYTPLHKAAEDGQDECVSLLIPVSDIDKQAANGVTPLSATGFDGQIKAAELLLEAGADINIRSNSEQDSLCRAVENGHKSLVSLLLKYIDKVDWEHRVCPLKLAEEKGHKEIVELLLDYKKNPGKYKLKRRTDAATNKVTPPVRVSPGSECPTLNTVRAFIKAMGLSEALFDHQHDVCFCVTCHKSRGDNLYYTRGDPPKDYGLPVGWCKLGLKVPARAIATGALQKWHVAFHGTKVPNVEKILITGDLLMPGDVTPEGAELRPPPGHFDPTVAGMAPPKGFDISKIYLSPSIRYSGCDVYAPRWNWENHHLRVAFQVRVKPGTYDVGPETIGAGRRQIDPKFPNSELEWSTKRRGVTVLVGLLVKVEGMGGEPDLDWSATQATPALPQPTPKKEAASTGLKGKKVDVLYPFNYTIAPGVDVSLEQGDRVTIVEEITTGFVVKLAGIKQHFTIPRNFLDL